MADTPPTSSPRRKRPARSSSGVRDEASGASRPEEQTESSPRPDTPGRASGSRTPDERKLIEALTGVYQMIGAGVCGIALRTGDPGLLLSGQKVADGAESVADAWIDLSRRSPGVKAALRKLTEVSAGGVVAGMHVAMFAPLLASRGVVPAAMAGVSQEEAMAAAAMTGFVQQNGTGDTPSD